MATGRFIVFEGGEASGKSTQAKLLAESLGAELTREPGGTELGEAVREIVLGEGDIDARAELLLMVAARAQHIAERIRPTLARGTDVVCERFSGSTLAYQGYGRGLPLEDVEVACELAADGLRADLNVLLEVPTEVALARRSRATDRIEAEDLAFHRRVHDGYLELARADPHHWIVLGATASPEQVHQERPRRARQARFFDVSIAPTARVGTVPVLERIVGQDRARDLLSHSITAPVHAYLFVGPPGAGKHDAARAFAARRRLSVSIGGCGVCQTRATAVLAGRHPDVVAVERSWCVDLSSRDAEQVVGAVACARLCGSSGR